MLCGSRHCSRLFCPPGQRCASGIASRARSVRRASSAAAAPLRLSSRRLQAGAASALLDSVETFLFDCDGVIWRGDEVIKGVPEALDLLRDRGKRLIFVTNNSTKSRAGALSKFHSLGIESVTAAEIFSSSFAVAAYLQPRLRPQDKVYIIGESGICEELDLVGISHLGGPSDSGKVPDMGSGGRIEVDSDVRAVVVGFDREICYYKLQYATHAIRGPNQAEFIATNCDAVAHFTNAQEWAAAGAMVGALKGATEQSPTVIGKPNPFMLEHICAEFGIERHQICMVGDRLDTDIVFGNTGGTQTLLVLSGVTSETELLERCGDGGGSGDPLQPDHVAESLPSVLELAQTWR